MSQSWFYHDGNQTIGPLPLDELRAAAASGLVSPDTQVCEGLTGTWCPASTVAEIFVPPASSGPVNSSFLDANGAPPPPPAQGGLAALAATPLVATSAPPAAPPVAGPDALAHRPQHAAPPPPPPGRSPLRKVIIALSGLVTGLVLMLSVSLFTSSSTPTEGTAVATNTAPAPAVETPAVQPIADKSAAAPAEPRANQPPPGESAAKTDTTAKKDPQLVALASKPSVAPPVAAAPPAMPKSNPFVGKTDPTPPSKLDELVFAKLKTLGIQPALPCSDEVFVRRVYLDIIGTLPTPEEAKDFLQDRDPRKRPVLIDRLLERTEFADYWAMKWSDLLRIKAEFPINLWPNAAQAYHRWVRTCLKENLPYDKFVREMLTACGSNFRVPQVNFYRALQSKQPKSIAQAVALTFMGTRADKWPPERLAGMASFFTSIGYKGTGEWKEEIVMFDPEKAKPKPGDPPPPPAVFPDGTPAQIGPEQDPREAFADWLITEKNPWFAASIVNRAWYWLLGRGLVHEADDARPDNPPENPELLAWLSRELISSHYDLKHIYRLIFNSKTYQLSSIPRSDRPDAVNHFASYALRRLEAEVLVDAVCQITGSTEKYSSMIPEPFTFVPENIRTIALPDGSITSSFLEMFGRPPRDTGMEAERNNRVTAAQRLHLLNSSHVRNKFVQSAKLQALGKGKGGLRETADNIYLTILSRLPTDEEFDIVKAYSNSDGAKGQSVLMNVAWALINSDEFLYRH